MSKSSVYCLATSHSQADEIVSRLTEAGFSKDDISVLLPDKGTTRDFAHQKSSKAPEGTATGAGAGGLVGGAVGLLAGLGALVIPGVGPLLAAGPIMAALSGAAVGATVGGLAGGLIGLGIPEYEAKRYEGKIREGNILISTHAESPSDVKIIKDIFQRSGAQDIGAAGEAGVPQDRGPAVPDHSYHTGRPVARELVD